MKIVSGAIDHPENRPKTDYPGERALKAHKTTVRATTAQPAIQSVKLRPTGKSPICLSSPICKNIPLRDLPKSNLYPPPSRLTEGRLAIVTDARRDAVDAAAPGARTESQGGMNPVSELRRAD